MSCEIFIENPPPLKHSPRGENGTLIDVSIEEGLETAEHFLDEGVRIDGFHHADLDRFEGAKFNKETPLERYDAFDYAVIAKKKFASFKGKFVPHHVVVYETPEEQVKRFRWLAEQGIKDVVLVGKPFSQPPEGVSYKATVEDVLSHLSQHSGVEGLRLGVIGIHTRTAEASRIADKYQASGNQLQVMGQFLDAIDPMIDFLDSLALEFEQRKLNLDSLQWNVGLAMFSLQNRAFYAALLRQESVGCESRFAPLMTTDKRIEESILMNVEYAQQLKEKSQEVGMNLGFSIQPIIEHYNNGMTHPAVYGAVELAKELQKI